MLKAFDENTFDNAVNKYREIHPQQSRSARAPEGRSQWFVKEDNAEL
ncbi:hypothetical protein IQ247_23730 [Plectonema cf. radiosum LEGE 06105]|uniref:Uncharacterized protein n=1 Tax=Plectonema cf. radiosum LEGE 06105 TaxID=945769 RepID=A0A8J7JVC7_9CYAN|nr:hypothetical protein [Plectonema radiosum]MBE9215639.1 hypothetical protein [Plectonema cf. radiosum LEGE 06105]